MKETDVKCTIQKTLFGEEIISEYEALTEWGESIIVPNFQPVEDDGTRLDYKKQYSILVHLNSEEEQDWLYEILKGKGFRCRKN